MFSRIQGKDVGMRGRVLQTWLKFDSDVGVHGTSAEHKFKCDTEG